MNHCPDPRERTTIREPLTAEDLQKLRYQCRAGILLPISLVLILQMVLFGFWWSREGAYPWNDHLVTGAVTVLMGIAMHRGINKKYLADIRNHEKVGAERVIQDLTITGDYEAGSKGRALFARYDFVIDNTRYRVDQELFEQCAPGDRVVMFYAPESRFLLDIVPLNKI